MQFDAIDESIDPAEPKRMDNPATASDLDTLLATLSDGEREALYLNCVEGYSTREISEQTGKPRGTILSLIARGRQKLQDRVLNETDNSLSENG